MRPFNPQFAGEDHAYSDALVPRMPQTRVMSPSAASSAMWLVSTCRVCQDVMAGPTVVCQSCHSQVHGHCVMMRHGHAVCNVCAADMDFAIASQRASSRLAGSGLEFGRIMSVGGHLAGQAVGAVATGTVAGAARLVTGCAAGACQAIAGAVAVEMPPGPQALEMPRRPRALQEYDLSDPVETDLMQQLREIRVEMAELREENRRLRAAEGTSSARGVGYATPTTDSANGVRPQGSPAPNHAAMEEDREGTDEVYSQDWSEAVAAVREALPLAQQEQRQENGEAVGFGPSFGEEVMLVVTPGEY